MLILGGANLPSLYAVQRNKVPISTHVHAVEKSGERCFAAGRSDLVKSYSLTPFLSAEYQNS